MSEIKHVGRLKANGRKVLVAYRTLPGDSDYCLVITTENLNDSQHDALIKVVESPAGQSSYELAEVLARSSFPDGSIMLSYLHVNNRLIKMKTDQVLMTPTVQTSIHLNELNRLIAEQRGVSINDLALSNGEIPAVPEVATIAEIVEEVVAPAPIAPALTPEELAAEYRAEAEKFADQAEKYRKLAEELVPTVVEVLPNNFQSEVIESSKLPDSVAKPVKSVTVKPKSTAPVKSTTSRKK